MLYVKTPEEVLTLIESEFETVAQTEYVTLGAAMGRCLAEDIAATEYVPDFDRSTVDGFAVRARDTFGCTDAIPVPHRRIFSLQRRAQTFRCISCPHSSRRALPTRKAR